MPWYTFALWILIGVLIVAWELYQHGAELLQDPPGDEHKDA